MATQRPDLKFSVSASGLLPQEEMLETALKPRKLLIGIPAEDEKLDNRVPITPEGVELLTANGHEVLLQTGAGKGAQYSDTDYSERGGQITDSLKQVLQADIVLKISPLTLEQIAMLRGQQVVISSLHWCTQTADYFKQLLSKKITALAFEYIKDDYNNYPVTRATSSIAGTTSILVAADYLSTAQHGKGVLLGSIPGITPAEVIIIGSGEAVEFAARAAYGLGAIVKVFDNSINNLVNLQNNLGFRLQTSVYHPQVLERNLKSADVVIVANQSYENSPRFYITEDMVRSMKRGSVIVDMSLWTKSSVETSELRPLSDPVYLRHGVIHYTAPNLASLMARTASIAISNVFVPILLNAAEARGFQNHLKHDIGLRHGVYIFNGILTNRQVSLQFNLPSKDIDLLMAAF